MDGFVPRLMAAVPGLLTVALFLVALMNAVGEIQAHYDASQFHSAPLCAVHSTANCVEAVEVSIEGYTGDATIVVTAPSLGMVPVPIGDRRSLPLNQTTPAYPTAMVWRGKVMEIDYDHQQILSADNPDTYVVSWPILLPFGIFMALVSVVVYLFVSWATGYLDLPWRRRRRQQASRATYGHPSDNC